MYRILILLLSISLTTTALAQGNSIPRSSKVQELDELPAILPDSVRYRYPLMNGLSVTINIFEPVMQVFKMKHASYEATVTADLHHRFFPQVALGMGQSEEEDDYGLCFRTKLSPFFKLGMLYNVKYNDTKPRNFYYVLFRYGFSSSKADIENLKFTDGYWDEYGPVTVTDAKYTTQWIEVGGGIKVQMYRRISMGWEATMRPILSSGNSPYGKPDFVPGRGRGRFGFAFNLTYDIF